ncbi:MAG TPA: glutamate synthase subunit alpha, partial [Solirubrobacteraceae bacterium]|nr:glutamate synthase subunit alpha [Solirubrobacteraceae bacterium]
MHERTPPGATGLYHPQNEHDACGVAMVAKLREGPSHAVVEKALDALENLEHRGAEGADPNTGDGAGILLQIPDAFFRSFVGAELPAPGSYGVGVCYLPRDPERQLALGTLVEETILAEGQRLIAWRDVPVDDRHVGDTARLSAPVIRQVVIGPADELLDDQDAFERKLYIIRRLIEREGGREVTLPSFSSRTLVYKGMLTAPQLPRYFTDLRDPRV